MVLFSILLLCMLARSSNWLRFFYLRLRIELGMPAEHLTLLIWLFRLQWFKRVFEYKKLRNGASSPSLKQILTPCKLTLECAIISGLA